MAWPTTSRQSRGYGAQHDRIRAELKRKVMFCEECTRHGRTRLGCVADHITPLARGGTGERSNYQWLCQSCSDAKTAEERGLSTINGGDASGWPTSPDHPWNRAG